MSISIVIGLVLMAVIFALSYAFVNFFTIKKVDEGTDRMKEIAHGIRVGANTFINYEYKIVAIVAGIIFAILAVFISWQTAAAFLIGASMSAFAGWCGMKTATYANVRVTSTANTTRSLGKTLKVAFKGGSVMGLCVGGFALLGIIIVYLIFGLGLNQLNRITENVPHNWMGMETPFTMTVSGYALGCSVIAMFARVGGGIYTKAADMGADLVGKTEAHIPEDDPRNPATIADNVGDNVGDVAGLGADLLESYVGAIMSAVILAAELFRSGTTIVTNELLRILMIFPLAFAAVGLISCVIGIATLLLKRKISDNPHQELNITTWISAGLTIALGLGVTMLAFKSFAAQDLKNLGFKAGMYSPWIAAAIGIAAGIAIGLTAEHYTSYDHKPTKQIANASVEGTALTITEGMSVGMRSIMLPVVILASAIFGSYAVSGMYGVSMAALGMLSFVTTTVSVDSYGPVSDNAGGIAEMSGLEKPVRAITDKLDSVGNTTAAIGKGFAIGSAALAALSMMMSYLYSYTEPGVDVLLNLVQPITLAGALVGAALPYMFSGILIKSVSKAARTMVVEVRRQFKEIPGLLEGTAAPDYKSCVEISSKGALREMLLPAIMAVIFPVACGFVFGAEFVGGVLIGSTLSAVMLALFTGNSGGAWDNAKKFIESGGVAGHGKGSPAHDASVVGDTVGDPLKDTVGPSLDIFIKIMSVVSVIMVVIFQKYNLLGLLQG